MEICYLVRVVAVDCLLVRWSAGGEGSVFVVLGPFAVRQFDEGGHTSGGIHVVVIAVVVMVTWTLKRCGEKIERCLVWLFVSNPN